VFATLLRKELLTNLLTLRVAVALLFSVTLGPLATYVGGLEHSRRTDAYEREVQQIQADLDEATTYQQVRPDFVAPPEPLAVFAQGIDKAAGQRMYVNLWYLPAGAHGVGDAHNTLMKSFAPFDFTSVVFLLLSFLAVVLGFDGLCGERASGTLRLVLANPVPRATVVLAKLVAGILTLCVPLALAYVVSLLILTANADVQLTGQHGSRLAVYFLVSSLFLAQVFALSLLVSASVRLPAVSLVICLFAWLIGGVGYGNLLPALVRYTADEPPHHVFVEQRRRENGLYSEQMSRWSADNPAPDEMYRHALWERGNMRFGHPLNHAHHQKLFAYRIEQVLDLSRRVGALQRANYAPLGDQARRVDRWAILSPFTAYRVLAKQVMRTTLDDKDVLRDAGHRYRDTYIGWLRGRNAFGDRRWYSDDPLHQEPLVPNPESLDPEMLRSDSPYMLERLAWAQEQSRLADADPARRLDLTDMPKFGERWQKTLPESLDAMAPGLAVLILSLGLGFSATVVVFARSDLV